MLFSSRIVITMRNVDGDKHMDNIIGKGHGTGE